MTRLLWKIFLPTLLFFPLSSFAADHPLVIPEVQVQAYTQSSSAYTEPVQTTSIHQKQILASSTTSFSDLLKQEQSIVRVINNTNDNSQLILSMRGFGDNAFANALVVVDGFPLTNPSVLAPSVNAISVLDVQNIDMQQGSAGTLWGSQATGGVVKIETLHPEKPIARAAIGYGSFYKKTYNLLLGDKLHNGFFFKLLGFSNNTDNYRDHNQQENVGMAWQMGVDYASGSLSLDAKIQDNRIDIPGGLTQQQYDSNPRQASSTNNFNHFQTNVYQLTHKQAWKDDWMLETRLSHSRLQGEGFIYSAYVREETGNRVNPVLTGTLWKSKLLLGYEGQASDFQLQNKVMQQKADAQQNDLYAQITLPFAKKYEFTLGGRTAWQQSNTYSNKNNQALSVDLHHQVFVSTQALTYHPHTAWDLFIRRDGNFRFPKSNEFTALPTGINTLLPQTGVSYEVGTKWHTPQHTTQLSAYRLQLHHEIEYDPMQTVATPFGTWSNFDTTLRQGMTLAEWYRLAEKWIAEGQLNYVDAYFLGGTYDHNRIPAVPAWTGNIGVSYQFKPNWSVKYNALYAGSAYASQDVDNIGQKLPGYWLSTIALQYKHKALSFHFAVENLFNQRYTVYTVYNPNTQTNIYYPGTGRNFLFTVKLFSD